jgi:glycosyltransferase involved in cell wall biosynthesis
MNIAIVAPPFIPVPPPRYGGTELFVAHLARTLHARGHSIVVYANGESQLPCEVRSLHRTAQWPIVNEQRCLMQQLEHVAWAIADICAGDADIVHVNDALAIPLTRFLAPRQTVLTIHHPHEPALSELYSRHHEVHYVAISAAQAARETMPHMSVIHHGIDLDEYHLSTEPRRYLAFLGRIAPCKGVREAIDVAHRTGIPLKIAGEIQPMFRPYWEAEVRPLVDGRNVEYVGEADLQGKNELLAGARALVFPIQWDEPFGLVMIEAMACGTPVIALRRGSVPEVVDPGVTGWICRDVDEMAEVALAQQIDPRVCRRRAEERFSVARLADNYERLYEEIAEGEVLIA